MQGKSAGELVNAQKKLVFACFCENSENEEIVDLPCKHVAHIRCSYLLYNCRICGAELNKYWDNPKEIIIWKYAK